MANPFINTETVAAITSDYSQKLRVIWCLFQHVECRNDEWKLIGSMGNKLFPIKTTFIQIHHNQEFPALCDS